jgi:hypothetical protein
MLSDSHRYRLLIKDSLLIRQKSPNEMEPIDHYHYVFPEGFPYRKFMYINNPPPGLSKKQRSSTYQTISRLDDIQQTTTNPSRNDMNPELVRTQTK